jgi:DNA-binding transcriptional regulator YdaS (Cro superfamily)
MQQKYLASLISAIGSQRKTARLLSVNERTVRRWVTGERTPCEHTITRLKELAETITNRGPMAQETDNDDQMV